MLELLQQYWWTLLGPVVVWLGRQLQLWIKEEKDLLNNPANPAFKTRMLRLLGPDGMGRDYSTGYKAILQRFLLWVDRYFGALPPPHNNNVKTFEQIGLSLSVSAFERLLQLAVVYPTLFVVTAWSFTNTGTLGVVIVLPPADLAVRVLGVFLLVLAPYSFYRRSRSDGRGFYLWSVFVFAVVVAGVFAIAIAIAIKFIHRKAESADNLALYYVALYIFAAFVFASSVWLIILYGEFPFDGFTFMLFLGVLPLLNAPLDWLSFGITRGLLRSIASGGHGTGLSLLWAAADLLLALVFLLLVALTTWTGIWLMNQLAVWAGGSAILDMAGLLEQLRTGSWKENLWIWLMLGSTLIPTAVHFLIASMAGFLALNRSTAVAAAKKMQFALDKVKDQRGEADKEAAVGVDLDARRAAFFYLYIAPALVVLLWLVMISLAALIFLHWVPDLVQWFLSLVNLAPELPVERKMFWMA